ncbi:MAG: tetratricopeptide repeat protein, partial [Myxococcota bacterium]|nr:tetratricopeptide repeat protein [Myxococcota bacterium]
MTSFGTGILIFATLFAQTPPEAVPFVSILSSEGRVIQQETSIPPTFTAELEVEIQNNLALPVDRVELEIRLQYENTEIPGWRITRRFDRKEIAANSRTFLSIKKSLPPQRRQFALHKIQYQVNIIRYRLKRFKLDTLVRLIQSPFLYDQSAALVSLDLVSLDHREIIRTHLAKEELERFFASKLIRPDPRVALELLVALRAVAALKIAEMIEPAFIWYSLQNQEEWGMTLIDLVQRVRRDSHSDERRLGIIPEWAKSTLSQDHRANTVLRELLTSCVLRLSDSAIPQLVLTKYQSPSKTAQRFASDILLLLGRQSAKEQFAMTDPVSLIEMVKVAEKIQTRPYIDGVISLLSNGHQEVRKVSKQTLIRVSEQAILPLAQTYLGSTTVDFREKELIKEILKRKPSLRFMVTEKVGLAAIKDEKLDQFIERLRDKLKDNHDSKANDSIRSAFEAFDAQEYEQSVRKLDTILHSSPKLVREKSDRIIDVYMKYAQVLYDSGDFDQAKQILSRVFLLEGSNRGIALLEKTSLALAEGYVALGQPRRAYEELRGLPSQLGKNQRLRGIKTKIL